MLVYVSCLSSCVHGTSDPDVKQKILRRAPPEPINLQIRISSGARRLSQHRGARRGNGKQSVSMLVRFLDPYTWQTAERADAKRKHSRTRLELVNAIFEHIEIYYNRFGRPTAIGFDSPMTCEALQKEIRINPCRKSHKPPELQPSLIKAEQTQGASIHHEIVSWSLQHIHLKLPPTQGPPHAKRTESSRTRMNISGKGSLKIAHRLVHLCKRSYGHFR